jgi:hypothetical protein
MSVPNVQALRKQLEEFSKMGLSESYVGDCAYSEGYSDGQTSLAQEILEEFFDVKEKTC